MGRYNELRFGPTAQKVLLLLLGGAAIGLVYYSPKKQLSVLKAIPKEWKRINERALQRAVNALYKSKLIDAKENQDGTLTVLLTDQGKRKALTYNIDNMNIPIMKKWDGLWRICLFDIPEKRRKARNALARALKNMGFYQFQKSVFVHPFECQNEINFVIEFFSLRPHVRYILAEHLDNELHLKRHFELV